MNSERLALGRNRAPLPSASTGEGRGNSHKRVGRHGPVASKLSDAVRDYLADQPRFVLIAVNGCVHRVEFIDFRPFHDCEVACD